VLLIMSMKEKKEEECGTWVVEDEEGWFTFRLREVMRRKKIG
jgi:hypothetical protein